MRTNITILAFMVFMFAAGAVFTTGAQAAAVEVGHTVCPVSGEVIGGMGPAVRFEYDGKIYNFCCSGCVEIFKKDPEKYVKLVEEQMSQSEQMAEGNAPAAQMGENMPAAIENASSAAQVKEFNLEAYQFGYSPETLPVKKGDVVKIHATSKDVPHGVFIKEYGINATVKKGEVADIEFVADKTGEFEIRCSVYCGAGHRTMKARLIVEP